MAHDDAVRLKDGVIRLAESLLEDNTRDFLLCYTGPDGLWYMAASNRTFGMGAARRAELDLVESCPPPSEDPDG